MNLMLIAAEGRLRRRLARSTRRTPTGHMTPDCIITSLGSSETSIRNGRSRQRERPAAWIPTSPSSTRILERL